MCVGEDAVFEVMHHEVGQLRKWRVSVDISVRRRYRWKLCLREPGDKGTH